MKSKVRKRMIVEIYWDHNRICARTKKGKNWIRLYEKDSQITELEIHQRGFTAITNLYDFDLNESTEKMDKITQLYVNDPTVKTSGRFPTHPEPAKRKKYRNNFQWTYYDRDDRTYADIK